MGTKIIILIHPITQLLIEHFLISTPNTASAENLKQLGLRDKTIQIIINYRSKGGRFKTAEDLQKIYGLSANDFDALKPYIQIASSSQVYTTSHSANSYPKKSYAYTKTPIVIDINKADSTMLENFWYRI